MACQSRLQWKGSARYYLGKTFICKNWSRQEVRKSSFDKLCFMGLLNVEQVQSPLLLQGESCRAGNPGKCSVPCPALSGGVPFVFAPSLMIL